MAIYNRAVTGDFTTWPYAVHQGSTSTKVCSSSANSVPRNEHLEDGPRRSTVPDASPPVTGAKLLSRATLNATRRLLGAIRTLFAIHPQRHSLDYQGTLIWLALLAAVWRFRSKSACLLCGTLAVTAECLLSGSVGALLSLALAGWGAAFSAVYRRNKWAGFMTVMIVIMALGQSIVLWWLPHYSAPIVPVLLAAVATTLQRIARRPNPTQISGRLGGLILLLIGVHFIMLGAVSGKLGARHAGENRTLRRVDVKQF